MRKLLLLLLVPALSFADRLGSLNSNAQVLLTTQAVAGSATLPLPGGGTNYWNYPSSGTFAAGYGMSGSTLALSGALNVGPTTTGIGAQSRLSFDPANTNPQLNMSVNNFIGSGGAINWLNSSGSTLVTLGASTISNGIGLNFQASSASVSSPVNRWETTPSYQSFDAPDGTQVMKIYTSSINVTGVTGLLVNYGVTAGSLTISNIASGTQCLHADGSGIVTGTGSDCGSGGGSGGSSIYPATATASFPYGLSASTISLNGSGAGRLMLTEGSSTTVSADIASGVDVLWADSGPHNLKFNPNNSSTYTVVGTSNPTTFMHPAVFGSSTGTLIDVGSVLGINGPTPVNYFKISMTDTLVTFQYFNSGVANNLFTWGSPPVGMNINTTLAVSGAANTIRANASILSVASGAGNLTDEGIVDLWSVSGKPSYVSFNEQGVANRGTLGFPAGSGDLILYTGSETFGSGTERLRVSPTGGLIAKTSATVQGAGGLGVTYGVTAASLTLTALTSQSCIGTDGSGNVQAGTCSGGGGGGSSTLETLFGTARSSPTATLKGSSDFLGSVTSSTMTISMNPLNSGITTFGSSVTFTNTAGIHVTTMTFDDGTSLKSTTTLAPIAAGQGGQLQYNIGGTFAASNTLFFDTTTLRMGINYTNPPEKLSVGGKIYAGGSVSAPGSSSYPAFVVGDTATVNVATFGGHAGEMIAYIVNADVVDAQSVLNVVRDEYFAQAASALNTPGIGATYLYNSSLEGGLKISNNGQPYTMLPTLVSTQSWIAQNYFPRGVSMSTLTLTSLPSLSCLGTDGSGNVQSGTCSGGSGSGYAVEPATVTFNLAKGFTASTGTVTGGGGFSVTYNATLGSATVNNLTASQIVVTDASKNLASQSVLYSTVTIQFKCSALDKLETNFAVNTATNTSTSNYLTCSFDNTTRQYANGYFMVPNNLDTGGTITIRTAGRSSTAAGSKNVGWELDHQPLANGGSNGTAYLASTSGALAVSATQGAKDQLSWIMSVTSSTWVANNMVNFKISRDVGVTNNLASPYYADLLTIELPVTTSATR